MIKEIKTGKHFSWIIVEFDKQPDSQELFERFEIDDEIIEYAIDKNERAHIEYNPKEDEFLLIFNAINLEKQDNHYETIPVTFLVKNKKLFTIVDKESRYVIELMKNVLDEEDEDLSIFSFLFLSLDMMTERYFAILDDIDIEKDILNNKLRKHTTKSNLLALSDLSTGIVYLTSAANQNVTLLEQTRTNIIYRQFSEVEKEYLDSTIIEAKQLLSMNMVISQILEQLSGTYNNILNNNLNDIVTNMNIVSIILASLAVITGFFGMNVKLPFAGNNLAWIIIIISSGLLGFLIYRILKNFFSRDNK